MGGDWLLIALLIVFLCGFTGVLAVDDDEDAHSKMEWIPTSNSTALCNDFTRSGFFIRRNKSSHNWVVYLESGGLCFNPQTCNRRFFSRKVKNN